MEFNAKRQKLFDDSEDYVSNTELVLDIWLANYLDLDFLLVFGAKCRLVCRKWRDEIDRRSAVMCKVEWGFGVLDFREEYYRFTDSRCSLSSHGILGEFTHSMMRSNVIDERRERIVCEYSNDLYRELRGVEWTSKGARDVSVDTLGDEPYWEESGAFYVRPLFGTTLDVRRVVHIANEEAGDYHDAFVRPKRLGAQASLVRAFSSWIHNANLEPWAVHNIASMTHPSSHHANRLWVAYTTRYHDKKAQIWSEPLSVLDLVCDLVMMKTIPSPDDFLARCTAVARQLPLSFLPKTTTYSPASECPKACVNCRCTSQVEFMKMVDTPWYKHNHESDGDTDLDDDSDGADELDGIFGQHHSSDDDEDS